MNITTQRLELKILDGNHAQLMLDFLIKNKEFFKSTEPLRTEEYFTLEFQKKLLDNSYIEFENKQRLNYWIFKKGENKIIGGISFSNIIYGAFQSCFLSYKLDQEQVSRGYMKEGLEAAIKFVFDNLKLHRIEANIMPENLNSLKLAEKLGFENEGLSKKYLKINNRWEDHIHMVLINNNE